MEDKDLTYELITPEKAREIIEQSEKTGFKNRKLSKALTRRYAQEMKDGNWRITGETISISHNGELLDGNHRLHAVCMADVPVKLAVARNAPPKTLMSMILEGQDKQEIYFMLEGMKNIKI